MSRKPNKRTGDSCWRVGDREGMNPKGDRERESGREREGEGGKDKLNGELSSDFPGAVCDGIKYV